MTSIKNKKAALGRIKEIILIVGFAISLIFITLTVVKISKGKAKTVERPNHLILLQIVNTPTVTGETDELIDELKDFKDEDFEIRVVDKDIFDVRTVDKSFIISRNKDLTQAKLLADKLELGKDNIIFQPLENNHKQVSVTLVLGEDFDKIELYEPDEI